MKNLLLKEWFSGFKMQENISIVPNGEGRDKLERNLFYDRLLTMPAKPRETLKSAIAMRDCLLTYHALRGKLEEIFDKDKLDENEKTFLDLYSLFVGAVKGLAYISDEIADQDKTVIAVRTDFNGEVFENIIDNYLTTLKTRMVMDGSDIVGFTKSFLNGLIKEAQEKKNHYSSLVEKINGLNIQLNGATFNGFSYRVKNET